jgi:hypothetical protein
LGFEPRDGIGLSLSKNLAVLMNGDIGWMKISIAASRMPGSTRFVIDLNTAPLNFDSKALDAYELSNTPNGFAAPVQDGGGVDDTVTVRREFRIRSCQCFFVDDDCVRKLFTRSLQRIAPDWNLTEASNGETALRLVGSQEFDLDMDQYMASVEKRCLDQRPPELSGPKALSIICGLSGKWCRIPSSKLVPTILIKPFPWRKGALTSSSFGSSIVREPRPVLRQV